MAGTSHRDLRVWQAGMDLASDCYAVVKRLPTEERFGLVSQIRRAAASVPANIAEGYGRCATRETIRYLNIANGSLLELDTHLELTARAGYLSAGDIAPMRAKIDRLGAMIRAFKLALRRQSAPPQAPGPRPHLLTPAPAPAPGTAADSGTDGSAGRTPPRTSRS
jgi:four helix bundle protein